MKHGIDKGFFASLWAHPTLRNLSYLMGAEGLSRVFRLCTTILMAQTLSIAEFGLLAIALTVFELIAVLANNGFGLFLLKHEDRHLVGRYARAYQLRYLARRSVHSRAPIAAMTFMRDAIFEEPRILLQEPARTPATAAAALGCAILIPFS